MEVGDKCTVSHHYGHTDTEKVMNITKIEENFACKGGIAVWTDGLEGWVSGSLINVITKSKLKSNQDKSDEEWNNTSQISNNW